VPALRRLGSVAGCFLATAIGCGSPPSSTASGQPAEQPSVREIDVGRHPVRLIVPPGWQHYDHGDQQRIEKGLAQITLTDLGPVSREAIRREIERSRQQFSQVNLQDARERLVGLGLREAVSSEEQWKQVEKPWRDLLKLGEKHEVDPLAIEETYLKLLIQVDALPARDLDEIAAAALPRVGHDAMRGIADEHSLVVDGRDALRIETWDRLSHGMRKSYLFIVNDGSLLVMRMELGRYPEMQEAFESVVSSLELPLPQLSGS